MKINAIVTMMPYAPFLEEVLRHPIVSGIRLNTVMPIKGPLEEKLKELNEKTEKFGKEFWIDLKCRQLRIKNYGVPPFTEIELSHEISVDTPATAYFSNGAEHATVLGVDGNKLIMLDGPKRVVGPGEGVNIPSGSLVVNGFFTDSDRKYIESASKTGLHNYMLSFVESKKDIDELMSYDKKASIIAKIESRKGLNYVNHEWKNEARLMAARGDLYIEVKMPHDIINAVEDIVKKDKDAIVASRLFSSFANSLEPSCEDIGDVDNLLRMGYKTLMFGDDICMKRDSIMSALNLLNSMAERHEK